MAGIAARNLYFNLDNSGGSPTDLSAYVNDVEFSPDFGLEDTTTFSSSTTAKSFTGTLKDGKISIKGPWNQTFAAHLSGIYAAAATKTFIVGMQGSTAGQEKITGECQLKSFKPGGKVDGVLMMQADFQCDGAVTFTTF